MTSTASLGRRSRRTARRLLGRLGSARFVTPSTAKAERRRKTLRAQAASPPVADPSPALAGPRVAAACGDRLRDGLAWEWPQIVLDPGTWRAAVAAQDVDLVLLETDGGLVPGWGNRPDEFESLLDWAAERGVPAIAWITADSEDPEVAASWIDRVHHIFIDDERAVEKWRTRWPGVGIEFLGSAAQPRIHNPRTGGPGRRRGVAACLVVHGESDALAELSRLDHDLLDIWPADNEAVASLRASSLRDVVVARDYVHSPSAVLQRYRVLAALGVGDAQSSWSIVEAGSAQTAVVAEPGAIAAAADDLLDHLVVADDPEALRLDLAAVTLQEELRDRAGLRLARAVYANHTFACRVDRIAHAAGVPTSRPPRTVSAIIPTNRAHELDNVVANVGRQAHCASGGVELIIVLHGLDLRPAEVTARARGAGVDNVTVLQADSSLTLGACMNLGVDASSGAFVAKMDDDNFYGRHYLTDLLAAFDYTDAGIVGKWAHYVWLRSTDAVILRFPTAEHRYERLVQGGSIVLRRDIAKELHFSDLPRGVDTDILNRAHASGILTYSADRFNYLSIRGADRHQHTWSISDSALMNKAGRLVFFGDPRQHVEV
jgi:Glycosyl transferase family 2